MKQNAKGKKSVKSLRCRKSVRRGERGKKEKGKDAGCTRIIIITLGISLSEIMSWQGQLQVFIGERTALSYLP